MTRISMAAALAVLVTFGAVSLKAADEAKKGGGFMRSIPYTMEQIKERLGADLAVTAEQEPKVKGVNDEFTKKMEEINKKEEVKTAMEAIKKAQESGDRQGRRELYTKLREAMGFDAREEYKKALTGILNEKQIEKLFPARGNRGGGGGGGGDAAKPPAEK